MTPERWEHVKSVLYAALNHTPAERSLFLEQACEGDDDLRREIESLLAFEEQKEGFIEVSAVELAGRALSESQATSLKGKRIGPYEIVGEIGRGGMGAVYLAQRADEEFQKIVAIKLVKRGMDTDAVLRRFRTERQILARLDHPNIARLYDGGTTDDGLPYFVMEHIEGLPILEYAARHRLSINERLELFKQVCGAVTYAHERHIIHRDLKPSNILVTEAGQAKLLDFGIAKLLNPNDDNSDDLTLTALRVMTPEYASPEQVRGKQITFASDIYSLGVVLYELLTGRRPYQVSNRSLLDLEQAICSASPLRPSLAVRTRQDISSVIRTPSSTASVNTRSGDAENLRRRLRGDLDNIVLMAMRKEPERRYASAAHLDEDIERHLQGLPVGARADRSGYRLAKFLTRHRAAATMTAVVIFLFVFVSVGYYTWVRKTAARSIVAARPHIDNAVRLTYDIADDNYAHWSANGEEIFFGSEREHDGKTAPYVMKWDGGDQRRASSDLSIQSIFVPAPDGKQIAFVRKNEDGDDLTTADVDGKHAKTLTHELGAGRIKWSLDGKRLVFNARIDRNVEIFTINADGTGLRNISNYPGLNVDPSWSPDGRRIAFTSKREGELRVFVMDAGGGNQTMVTSGPGNDRTPAWSPDGRTIAFVSDREGHDEIYLMDVDGRNQRRLTFSLQDDQEPAWAPDGSRIAFTSTRNGNQDIYVIPLNDDARGKVASALAADSDPCWSPDDSKIVFASNRDGPDQIYLMDADGWNVSRLTFSSADDRRPVFSPDGKRIAFVSTRDGQEQIFLMNADGTGETRLTQDSSRDREPAWSPDGMRLAFSSLSPGGKSQLYVINADGSNRKRLTDTLATDAVPAWSPDGKLVAFQSDRDGNLNIFVMSADGGNQVNLTRSLSTDGQPAWSSDGRRIIFNSTRSGATELYVMDADGGNVKQLTNTKSGRKDAPSWSHDRKRVVFATNESGISKIRVIDAPR